MRKLRAKMDELMIKAMTKANELASKKVEGIDGFIVTIIIIVCAIAIGLVFRDQIIDFIKDFFNQFKKQTANLFS